MKTKETCDAIEAIKLPVRYDDNYDCVRDNRGRNVCVAHRKDAEQIVTALNQYQAVCAERDRLLKMCDAAEAVQFDGITIIKLPIGWGYRSGKTLGNTMLEAFAALQGETDEE